MKTLIVYDTQFGDTKEVADAIATELGATAVRVKDYQEDMLKGVSLFVLGSPVQGGKATEAVQTFLINLSSDALSGVRAAAFDTRIEESSQNFAIRALMKTIGYAAQKMADSLKAKGAVIAAPPEGFIVTGKKGPLKDGELIRARTWAKSLLK